MSRLASELDTACEACLAAGVIISRHYRRGPIEPQLKADRSPLTAADLEANEEILDRLRRRFPEDGILSEETEDDGQRLESSRVWLVDPLDGTRDFVERTGDFAVLIGLVEDGITVLGVVYQPVTETLYFATKEGGAFMSSGNDQIPLQVSGRDDIGDFRIGVTRFNVNAGLRRFITSSGLEGNIVQVGASIKMMALARGDIELSVCLNGDEKEWDTCAPEVIVRAAGGSVSDIDGRPFRYNKPDISHRRGILMSNGNCHADLVELTRPYFAS